MSFKCARVKVLDLKRFHNLVYMGRSTFPIFTKLLFDLRQNGSWSEFLPVKILNLKKLKLYQSLWQTNTRRVEISIVFLNFNIITDEKSHYEELFFAN